MEEKQEKVAEFYDKVTGAWDLFYGVHLHDGYYEPGTTATMAISQDAVIRMIDELLRFAGVSEDPAKKPRSMLDVGSGLGGTCVYVAKKYDIQCTGITISPNQVKYAQDYAATEGVENKVSFDCGDALDMPYSDGKFDVVFTINCIEHVHNKEKFIREMVRVAAPGAAIIIASQAHPNLSPGESLKPRDKKILQKICDGAGAVSLCSSDDYVRWLTPLPVKEIKAADWTQNITPLYPLLMKEAFTWKGFTSIVLKGGWRAINLINAVRLVAKAANDGILKFAVVTGRKSI